MSCSRSSGISNSDRSRWKLTEQQWFEFGLTVYNIHSAATWRRWPNDKKVWSGQSLATKYTWRSRSWRWLLAADPENNTQGLGEKMHSSNKQHRCIHKDKLHQPQNTNSLRHRRLYHDRSLRVSLHLSKLLVPGFGPNVMLCRGRKPRARVMAAYIRDG